MWQQLVGDVGSGLNRPPGFEYASSKSLKELIDAKLYFDIIEKTQQLIGEANEPTNQDELMELIEIWLWRFRALLATRQGALVAQEASEKMKNLDELPTTDQVWDLRLLLVPVWAKGINQQAIQLMFSMGLEARTELMKSASPEWTSRLRRLGLEVAAALVGMRDFPTAINHLKGLYNGEKYANSDWCQTVAHALSLIYIYLGDTVHASEWSKIIDQDLTALEAFATEDYELVLKSESPSNLRALAQLHLGNVQESVEELEKAIEQGPNPALIVNLFMTYDLIERDSAAKKQRLRDLLASKFQYIGFYQLL